MSTQSDSIDAILDAMVSTSGICRLGRERCPNCAARIAKAKAKLEQMMVEVRVDEHSKLTKHGESYGFEKLRTVVEYQDRTSKDIPARHHWNNCYDRFMVTIKSRANQLHGLNPYGDPIQPGDAYDQGRAWLTSQPNNESDKE